MPLSTLGKKLGKKTKKYAKHLNKKISRKLSTTIINKKTGKEEKRKVNCKCIGKYCACERPTNPFGKVFR